MGKQTKSPDPVQLAGQQQALNTETAQEIARLNRLQQQTPFGTVDFAATGDPAQPFKQTITLDPTEQASLDKSRQLTAQLLGIGGEALETLGPELTTPLDFTGLPTADPTEINQQVVENMLGRTDFQRQIAEDEFMTRMANQGFDPTSEGFAAQRRLMDQAENDRQMAAALAGVQAGATQFGTSQAARQQAINEQLQQKQLPVGIAQLLGLPGATNVPQPPGQPAVNIPFPDLMGAVSNQQFADAQRSAANLGGLYGLGGAGLSALFG